MRDYPEVCPKCGEDMEPIFGEPMTSPKNPDEPIYWECRNFECKNFGKKTEVSECFVAVLSGSGASKKG